MLTFLMAFGDEPEMSDVDTAAWWKRADPLVARWANSLKAPFQVGYDVVSLLGAPRVSAVDHQELRHLITGIVNDVAMSHVDVVDDIRALRASVPACFGYAVFNDEIRAKEVLSRFQRHAGTVIELPSEVAQSTMFLDAMEHAQATRDERAFFRVVASAAFHVGIGAAVEDAIKQHDAS
jgi:hypothetical protein